MCTSRLVLGSVFAFFAATSASGQGPCSVQRIETPTGASWFGAALAVEGDCAIIGPIAAELESGLAYAFRRTPLSVWVLEAPIIAADGQTGDAFGMRADLEGDLLVIGAAGDDDAGQTTGSIYIYRREGGSARWNLEQKVVSPDPRPGTRFGSAIAISGESVAVCASGEVVGTGGSGTTYIVERGPSGLWSVTQSFTSPFGEPDDGYAASVDLDHDWLVVGAPYLGGEDWHGAACVYRRGQANRWTLHAILYPPITDRGFGSSVNVSGRRLAIGTGAQTSQSSYALATSFFVLDVRAGAWTETDRYVAPAEGEGDGFFRLTASHEAGPTSRVHPHTSAAICGSLPLALAVPHLCATQPHRSASPPPRCLPQILAGDEHNSPCGLPGNGVVSIVETSADPCETGRRRTPRSKNTARNTIQKHEVIVMSIATRHVGRISRRGTFALVALVASASVLAPASIAWGAAAAREDKLEQSRREAEVQTICLPSSPTTIRLVDDRYSVALDGVNFSRVRPVSSIVRLRYAEFDPVMLVDAVAAGEPPIDDGRLAIDGEADGEHVYIVQFVIPPIEPLVGEVRDLGARPLAFLADQCFIVRMTPAVRDAVAQLPTVRWVGVYQPAYRLDETIRAALADGAEGGGLPPQRYSIQMFERGPAAQEAVMQRIEALGGAVTLRVPEGFRIEATLTAAQLLGVVGMNEILFIDPRGEPGEDMDIARQIGGAVPIISTAGFTGQGVRAEVLDGGVRTTHVALQNPPILLHGANGTSLGHGTNTTGCVFGDGTGNAAGTGMLPAREQIIFAAYPNLTNRHAHTAELVNPAGPYRAVFQSNSWGDALTTQYTTISSDMDDLLFINDILICQSQSNAGTQMSRPQAWAKNIVSVGGVTHGNTLDRTDDRWATGSASVGPAADGRIKPDLAHFYDNVTCTSSSSTNPAAYTTTFGGTSAATPITAGHFGLMFQMWHEEAFPGFGGQSTVFDSRPHMSTAKALMINTAFRYDWLSGGNNATLTRVRQGWGMADLGRLYGERDSLFIVNEDTSLAPFASQAYELSVPAGQPDFRATLVYTDPHGNPASTVHRINDLSLKVTSPTGQQYWGNNGLSAGNFSTPDGVSNTRDTVENVFIANLAEGTWTVEVFADEVVQDANTDTPEIDAAYALVVTGAPVGDVLGDVNGDGVVDVDDLIAVILAWGPCPVPPDPCPADIAPHPGGNGVVDVDDLIMVILNWG